MPYVTVVSRAANDSFGAAGDRRNIASVTLGFRVTLSGAPLGTVAVGRLFGIRNSTTGANNGNWTIYNVATPGLVFDVAEGLTNQGASGEGCGLGFGTEKIAGLAITSFVDTQTIQVAGANFETNAVQPGDRFAVYGDALNDGSYYIDKVLDQANVRVVDRNLAANPLTAGAPTPGAACLVSDPYLFLDIVDEATSSWGQVETNIPFLVDSRSVVGGYTLRQIKSVMTIRIAQNVGGTNTIFSSQDEILIQYRTDGGKIDSQHWDLSGGSALTSISRMGLEGSDDFGFNRGSVSLAAMPGAALDGIYNVSRITSEFFGSAVLGHGRDQPGQDAKWVGCLVRNYTPFIGFIGAYEDARWTQILYSSDAAPFGVIEPGTIMQDVFLGDTATFSFVAFGSPVISSFRLSDDVYRPPWRLLGVPLITFRDPKEDYTLAELLSYADANSLGEVVYSWIPRFVYASPSLLTLTPVSGLTIHVYQGYVGLGEIGEIAGSPWVTDASGLINSGNPVYLKARNDFMYLGTRIPNIEMFNRITVEGPNFRFINRLFKMRAPFDGDVPVALLSVDFEGEMPI
jgi:hypothetical protein